MLINEEKKYLEYKHIIFYTDYLNIKEEILYSPPFIEITENNLNNRYNKNIEELIYHEIYESKSKLCDEPNCINSGKIIKYKI